MSISKLLKPLIGLSLLLLLSSPATADETNTTSQDTNSLSVDFTEYYLSVHAENININDLFKEISSKTGVKIIAESPIDYQVSIDFKKKGFTRGMKLILSQLEPEEYKGKLNLGKTFAGSTYKIRRISEQEIHARQKKADVLNTQGEKLLEEGKDYQAYSYFIKALRSNKGFIPAHKNLVGIYELWEDHEKLSKRLEKVIKLEPDDVQNYRLLADAYRRSYRYDKAAENYNKFITRSRKKADIDSAKDIMARMDTKKQKDSHQKISEARNLIRERQLDKASRTLNEAVNIDPTNTVAYELLAMTCEIRGDYETAIKWRKKLAELVPNDPKNFLLLGRDLKILTKNQAALESLTKAKMLSKSEYMKLLVEKELEFYE